jgi:hypothetical protein
VHEEKSTDTKDVVASAVVNPASTASADDADEDPGATPNNSSKMGKDNDGRDEASVPSLGHHRLQNLLNFQLFGSSISRPDRSGG